MKKKVWSCLLAACVIVCLSACGNSASGQTESTASQGEAGTNAEAEDNQNEAGTNGEGTTTFGDWYIKEYIDEFGDATDDKYFGTDCLGTFENSATKGSDLYVMVGFDPSAKTFLFRLAEYGDHVATYTDSSELELKYKTDQVAYDVSLKGAAPNGDLQVVKADDYEQMKKLLSNGKDLKAVIYIDSSKYNFTISSAGFDQLEEESEKIKEELGIKGTYREVEDDEHLNYYQIIPDDKTSGTIVFHYDKVLTDEDYNYDNRFDDEGNVSFAYTYDVDTHVLSLSEEDANWLHMTFGPAKFIVEDGSCFGVGYEYEGTIPDDDTFEAMVNPINDEGVNKDATYAFHKDSSFESYGISRLDGKEFRYEGGYMRMGNLLYITRQDVTKSSSSAWTSIYYIHDNKLLEGYLYTRD